MTLCEIAQLPEVQNGARIRRRGWQLDVFFIDGQFKTRHQFSMMDGWVERDQLRSVECRLADLLATDWEIATPKMTKRPPRREGMMRTSRPGICRVFFLREVRGVKLAS